MKCVRMIIREIAARETYPHFLRMCPRRRRSAFQRGVFVGGAGGKSSGEGNLAAFVLRVNQKEVHGVNARRLMYKLQTALCANGVHVRIDQRQHWSDKAGRMLTIYKVRNEDGALLCKFYRAIDVVQALAELLSEYGGGSE